MHLGQPMDQPLEPNLLVNSMNEQQIRTNGIIVVPNLNARWRRHQMASSSPTL